MGNISNRLSLAQAPNLVSKEGPFTASEPKRQTGCGHSTVDALTVFPGVL